MTGKLRGAVAEHDLRVPGSFLEGAALTPEPTLQFARGHVQILSHLIASSRGIWLRPWGRRAAGGSGRPAAREHTEFAAAVDSVCFEVRVVNGEDGRQLFAPREIDESGIGEIHGPVPIARHQDVDFGKF